MRQTVLSVLPILVGEALSKGSVTLSGLEDTVKHRVLDNVSETQGQGLDGAAALD